MVTDPISLPMRGRHPAPISKIQDYIRQDWARQDCTRHDHVRHDYANVNLKPAAIAVKNVGMVLGAKRKSLQVLKDIDLQVHQGKIHLLMGPSGSGKTTLLSILAGLLTPTEGSVHLLGQEITRMSKKQLSRFRLENIGFVFQNFNLFPALTAAENVEVSLNIKGIRGRQAHSQARELLEQVGLAAKVNQLPADLSGGQKQRVAIARALAGDPKLILADEPTASLDSHNGHALIELLRQLVKQQGRTVLIVTHDPRILDVADRVTYLEDGKLSYSHSHT